MPIREHKLSSSNLVILSLLGDLSICRIQFLVLLGVVIAAACPLTTALTLTMGLLKVGTPKTWDDSKKNLKYIRNAGVKQFISTYNRVKDLKGDELLWGDEIEYGIFHIDQANKKTSPELAGSRNHERSEQTRIFVHERERSRLCSRIRCLDV
mmetsp:Transcript_14395/g.32656  ORF Transcript_14395/g.32656 Transcript_14395/m.32656 type:complete len:153 (-) Transcript_14395:2616-3074(-)